MGKLEDAVKRMERAVARLEKAASRVADGDKAHHGALAAAKADYAALLDTTDSVAARLDAAILRLDRALEG
jgi:exonuclease VII small subunit